MKYKLRLCVSFINLYENQNQSFICRDTSQSLVKIYAWSYIPNCGISKFWEECNMADKWWAQNFKNNNN
jgi:hypothetical protein